MAKYTANLWDKIVTVYADPMMQLGQRLAKELRDLEYNVTDPFVMDADTYSVELTIEFPHVKEAHDRDIGITISIEDSLECEGIEDPFGVSFHLRIIEFGGRIVGGLTPYNYTEQCWVDATDDAAVKERWELLENHCDADQIAVVVEEFRLNRGED